MAQLRARISTAAGGFATFESTQATLENARTQLRMLSEIPEEDRTENTALFQKLYERIVSQCADRFSQMEGKALDFGSAWSALTQGNFVRRAAWHLGQYVYREDASTAIQGVGMPVPGHSGSAKPSAVFERGSLREVRLLPRLDMFMGTGDIQVGWTPSQMDLMADDWEVVD